MPKKNKSKERVPDMRYVEVIPGCQEEVFNVFKEPGKKNGDVELIDSRYGTLEHIGNMEFRIKFKTGEQQEFVMNWCQADFISRCLDILDEENHNWKESGRFLAKMIKE